MLNQQNSIYYWSSILCSFHSAKWSPDPSDIADLHRRFNNATQEIWLWPAYWFHVWLFLGAILYADDIAFALLTYSCSGLQQLINICIKYGLQWIHLIYMNISHLTLN